MKASKPKRELLAKNLKYLISNSAGTAHNQKDLADALGVTQTAVSYWLSANKFPRDETLNRIADYFGISVSDLIDSDYELQANTENLFSKMPVTQAAFNEYFFKQYESATTDSEREDALERYSKWLDETYLLPDDYVSDFLDDYFSLNPNGQEKVRSYTADLADNPKYRVDGDE